MFKAKIPSINNLKPETKAKIKKNLPAVVSVLILVCMVMVTIFHATDGFTTIVNTEPAKIVTESDRMSFNAYILKNEKTIDKDLYGSVYYFSENAERVNPGDIVAKEYKNTVDTVTLELSKEIDRCISILERSIGDGKFNLGDSKEVSKGISSSYHSMMRAISSGNASVISSLSDDFLVLLNRMRLYSGKGDGLKDMLSDLKAEKKKISEKYKGENREIKTELGGYFFRETDGYEEVYTCENINKMTYDSFFEMTEKKPSEKEFVGKILVDYRWYLVIPTVKGISDTYDVGGEYEVSFPDSNNKTMKMQLYKVVEDSSKAKTLMVFMCGIVDKNFDYYRIQKVNINHRDISGFRVPAEAVCEVNGNTGVYILKDGKATFRKIIILYEGDGFNIVSADSSNSEDYYIYLELNDNIITSCRNMYEGKVIG